MDYSKYVPSRPVSRSVRPPAPRRESVRYYWAQGIETYMAMRSRITAYLERRVERRYRHRHDRPRAA